MSPVETWKQAITLLRIGYGVHTSAADLTSVPRTIDYELSDLGVVVRTRKDAPHDPTIRSQHTLG
jgi:hypothetical protein